MRALQDALVAFSNGDGGVVLIGVATIARLLAANLPNVWMIESMMR